MLTARAWVGSSHHQQNHGVVDGYDRIPRHQHNLLLGEKEPRRLVMARLGMDGKAAPSPSMGIYGEEVGAVGGGGMLSRYSRRVKKKKRSESEEGEGEEVDVAIGSSSLKVCVDCGTSETPLWRGGPAGPKTLCNACGIRCRKMRRLSGAGRGNHRNGSTNTTSSLKSTAAAAAEEEEEEEEVKQRQRKRREVLWLLLEESRKLFGFACGKEEAEAAVLLMALSSDLFVHSQAS